MTPSLTELRQMAAEIQEQQKHATGEGKKQLGRELYEINQKINEAKKAQEEIPHLYILQSSTGATKAQLGPRNQADFQLQLFTELPEWFIVNTIPLTEEQFEQLPDEFLT